MADRTSLFEDVKARVIHLKQTDPEYGFAPWGEIVIRVMCEEMAKMQEEIGRLRKKVKK